MKLVRNVVFQTRRKIISIFFHDHRSDNPNVPVIKQLCKNLTEIHSIPLTAGLTPVVFLQNIQKTYLGKPFTDCIKTNVENNYNFTNDGHVYKPSNCVYRSLLSSIASYCNCYPSYIGQDWIN